MIKDNAEKMLMTADLGPEIDGYENKGLGEEMEIEEESSEESN